MEFPQISGRSQRYRRDQLQHATQARRSENRDEDRATTGAKTISRRVFLIALVAAGLVPQALAADSDAPAIAAAANLEPALREIAQLFTQQSRREVRLVFGASGTFAQQIAHGAPFEVFLSADETYVEFLFKQGRAMDAGRVHSIGKLALYVPRESNSPVDWPGFVEALKNDRLRRIAIANPQIAPFGHAAREALQAEGVWERVADRLVLGENVGQAAQFALSGGAEPR